MTDDPRQQGQAAGGSEGSDRGEGPDPEEALDHVLERVRNVRHLGAFEVTHREDGRFRCELQKPLNSLTRQEAHEAAAALEELARLLRKAPED